LDFTDRNLKVKTKIKRELMSSNENKQERIKIKRYLGTCTSENP